jgi:hypothetical protein
MIRRTGFGNQDNYFARELCPQRERIVLRVLAGRNSHSGHGSLGFANIAAELFSGANNCPPQATNSRAATVQSTVISAYCNVANATLTLVATLVPPPLMLQRDPRLNASHAVAAAQSISAIPVSLPPAEGMQVRESKQARRRPLDAPTARLERATWASLLDDCD